MKTFLILSYVDTSTIVHVVNAKSEDEAYQVALKMGAPLEYYDIFNTKLKGCIFCEDTVLV